MAIDPTNITPLPGAGNPPSAAIAPSLLRYASSNLIGGSAPALPSYSPSTYFSGRREADGRKQARLLTSGGSIAIFGDSNTDGCDWSQIAFSTNYGIGGDTIEGLTWRIVSGYYSSLANARAIVLANVPFNNLCTTSPDISDIETKYAALLAYFTGPLVILPPTRTSTTAWNTSIGTFNTWLLANYSARANTKIVDISDLQDGSGAAISGNTLDGQHWTGPLQTTIVNRVQAALRFV
jgi:hypothetical protein